MGHLQLALIWRVVALELSSFLASCLTLLVGNFSKSTLPITDGLGHKHFITQEEPEDIPLQDLSCLRWVFS